MISQDIELFEYTFIEQDILDLSGVLAMGPANLLSTNKTNKHACKSSKFRYLQVHQQNTEKNTVNFFTQLDKIFKSKCKIMSFWEKYDNPKRSDPKMKIDQFSLMQLLGKGSYGRVVLAQQKRTKQTYAIKILNIQKIIKKHQVEHTNNEKRILFACDHANIIRIHACFKDSTNLYYLLDVYPAGDFYTLLNAHTYFGENHAKFYAANVYLAFEYLHANNVVYRDLKPENLLVSNTGYLALTDFGFAKCFSETNCARTYSICGTGDYFSPELLSHNAYGLSVDWWSFGIFCYEINSGTVPFKSHNLNSLFHKILNDPVDMPNWFSKNLTDLCDKLLVKCPETRLGCSKNFCADVRNHAWFSDINWQMLLKQEIEAPFKPDVKTFSNTSSTSQLIDYETNSSATTADTDQYKSVFETF